MKVNAVDNSRVRNLAFLIALILLYAVPTYFISVLAKEPVKLTLDIVSVLMMAFGVIGMWLIAEETWRAFWNGSQDRTAIALFGLFSLFFTVVTMRSYGVTTRNSMSADAYLSGTYVYSFLVYFQFIALWLFTRASTPPSVPGKRGRWGQIVVGIIIGAVVASSKVLEPVIMFFGRLLNRMF